MWIKLVEIVKIRVEEKNALPRHPLAKTVNALYGAMTNCQVAFIRCESRQGETDFANLVFAIDALLSSLQNLNPQLEIFDPDLADRLENYALGEERVALMAQPRELVKSQLKLLRQLVRMESSVMQLPMEELGSFSQALEDLGQFIEKTFTLDEIYRAVG